MFSKTGIKLVAAVIATAIAGTAAANTTLDATTSGDLFLNIVNTSAHTTYLYDTGVTQAAFTGNTSTVCSSNSNCTFALSGDSALTSFLATGGTYDFSVLSSTKGSSTVVDTTGNIAPTGTLSTFLANQTNASINNYLVAADNTASTTATPSKSVVLTDPSASWDAGLSEGSVSTKAFGVTMPPYADQGALDSSLPFYSLVGGTATSTFAGTWSFSGSTDQLTYTTSAVPLPTPMLLLLSGLGLMGAVSRRAKASA